MTDKPGGYGRYKDDPKHVGCPRAKTDMTPCIARDGQLALSSERYSECVGCGASSIALLDELDQSTDKYEPEAAAADRLRDLVRELTEPTRA